jgi:hypothetical protein
MAAFARFDPYAALADEIQDRGLPPAKVAKVAKAGGTETGTLATPPSEIRNPEPPPEIRNPEPPPEPAPPARNTAPIMPEPWFDLDKERAAIVEYEAGVPRAWAEGFARLHPDRPPGDVPPARWRQFVDDCGRFLDDGFAATAAALGWGPLDLFGCDTGRPFARIDQMGLLWLTNGSRLVAITAETAVIERPSGARQTYRRRPNDPGRVLAWAVQ